MVDVVAERLHGNRQYHLDGLPAREAMGQKVLQRPARHPASFADDRLSETDQRSEMRVGHRAQLAQRIHYRVWRAPPRRAPAE